MRGVHVQDVNELAVMRRYEVAIEMAKQAETATVQAREEDSAVAGD